jgi:hypothetical protein
MGKNRRNRENRQTYQVDFLPASKHGVTGQSSQVANLPKSDKGNIIFFIHNIQLHVNVMKHIYKLGMRKEKKNPLLFSYID